MKERIKPHISDWSFPGNFKQNENGENLWPIEKKG